MKRLKLVFPMIALVAGGCDDDNGFGTLPAPANLLYQLEPSGDPLEPAGLLLFWDPVLDNDLEAYNVFSRLDGNDSWDLRGTTTSTTFHDVGQPDLEYFVVGMDFNGDEGVPSDPVVIDERLRLEMPSTISSISLDGAIHVSWSDNPFIVEPAGFKQYRVYSTSYDLDAGLCDDDGWALEGTTVAPEFLVGVLPNGVPRCHAVSAESVEGWESLWSPIRADTPRFAARNVLMFAIQTDALQSGFLFDDGAVLGIVTDGNRTDIDFWIDRDANNDFFFVAERAGTQVVLYDSDPIDDLTSIDIAPISGFSRTAIQASPGFGYVFEMDGGDGFARFGAIRVTHVGTEYLIFDWSYQTDPGNPELSVHGGEPVEDSEGIVIRR